MRVLFVCGGTAGHINPALAVAGCLRRIMPEVKILFAATGRDLEKKLISAAGYDLINIRMSGIRRGISPGKIIYNIKTAKNLVAAGREAEKLMNDFMPDAVLGTGGYICYPVLIKAAKKGIPTLIHEANAVPGLTTKMLSARVDKVLASFKGQEMHYRRPGAVLHTGMPVRENFQLPPDAAKKPAPDKKPLVVSFWGSLGAERLNEMIADFIKLNIKDGGFDHIHAAGTGSAVKLIENKLKQPGAALNLPAGVEIREYIEDMPSVMAAADIVVCRAGASTIAELTLMGKPSVLIPSPYVTGNHQEKNAMELTKAGGALMLDEKMCTGASLYETVLTIISDKDKLNSMAAAQKSLGIPNAAEKIAGLIQEIIADKERTKADG